MLFSACGSGNGDLEKANAIAKEWVEKEVIPLYEEKDEAVLLTTYKDITEDANDGFLNRKYLCKTVFSDFDYDYFAPNKQFERLREDLSKTDEEHADICYNPNALGRAADIRNSRNLYEFTKLSFKDYYVIRFNIKYKNHNPSKSAPKYFYDRVDVILDEKFRILVE